MDTFDICKKRLIEIGNTSFEADSELEVKEGIKLCNSLIREIRTIKSDLNLEIKSIRNRYSQENSKIASKNYSLTGLIFGRSTPGRLRADNKRQLSLKLRNAISPYENLKLTADDLINQIANIKNKYEKLKGSFPMVRTDEFDKKDN
jgi:uncharacterized SAM-dependent methyltransferase